MPTATKTKKAVKKAAKKVTKKARPGSYAAVLEAVEFAKKTNLAKRYGL